MFFSLAHPLLHLTLAGGGQLFQGAFKSQPVSGGVCTLLGQDDARVAGDEPVRHFIPQDGRTSRVVFSDRL